MDFQVESSTGSANNQTDGVLQRDWESLKNTIASVNPASMVGLCPEWAGNGDTSASETSLSRSSVASYAKLRRAWDLQAAERMRQVIHGSMLGQKK